jgi:hypothetical protein
VSLAASISCRSNSLSRRSNGAKGEASDEFYTPPFLVQALGAFDLDPCAGPMNHAAQNFRMPQTNGLETPWFGRIWLNPPYNQIHLWIERFISHGNGVILVNARVETHWFQGLVQNSTAVFFPRSRVNFSTPEKSKTRVPVGSALIAIGEANAKALKNCNLPGLYLR